MNLKPTILTAAFSLSLCFQAAAQTTRVAYVDIDRVTEKSEKVNSAMSSVKGHVEEIQKDIESKRKRLVELRADIKKGDGVLADTELKKKRDEATALDNQMSELEIEGRRELQKLDTNLFEPMIKTIVLAIQDVAREKNIDLVVRGEAVIYGSDSSDITEDVIKKLNSSKYIVQSGKSDSESKSSDSGSAKTGSSDEESTSSSSEPKPKSNTTKVKSGPGTDSKDESASSDSATPAAGKATPASSKSLIPLVKRPVDRQSD